MKSYEHVKDKRYFNKIIKEGKTLRNKHFVICYLKSENYNYKIGIAVSTKLGHAFYRNKLKRQIRNIVTDNKFLFKNYNDYIIILTRACINEKYEVLNIELKKIIEKIGE